MHVIPLDNSVTFGVDSTSVSRTLIDSTTMVGPVQYAVAEDADIRKGVLAEITVKSDGVMRGRGKIRLPLSGALDFTDELDEEPIWLETYRSFSIWL